MRRAIHILEGVGPQEESTFYDHPYFGQLFLAGIFKIIGYPDSLNPSLGNVHSIEMLYLVPRILMGMLAVADTFLIYKITESLQQKRCIYCICSVCSNAVNNLAHKKDIVRYYPAAFSFIFNIICSLLYKRI